MKITPETVKERLRAAIVEKHDLPDFELLEQTWAGLVEEELFADYKNSEDLVKREEYFQMMIEMVETWYRRTGRPLGSREPAPAMISPKISPAPQSPRVRNPQLRQRAVSELLAHSAAEDESVVSFRRDWLKNQLLTPEEVGGWIEEQARRDGRSKGTVWFEFPLPDRYTLTPGEKGWYTSPPLTISRRTPLKSINRTTKQVSYGVPGDPYIQWKSVSFDGGLDKLRTLSEALSKKFPWDEGQATIFVLTGVPPLAEPLRVTLKPRGGIPVAARIVLEIDPALPPRQVAEAYVRQRRNFLGKGRYRSLDDKHLHLAMFAAKRPQGESLATSLESWNKFCEAQKRRDWKYRAEDVTNFGRDLSVDPKRLLYPGRTRFAPYGFAGIG